MEFTHALQLYGAAAVTAFGWAACALLRWDALGWMSLWLCGALLAYNVDRLKEDAADAVNVPGRLGATRRWRRWNAAVAVLAGATLLAVPAWRGDWLTLGLVLGGALTCLGYSLPRPGWRLKDVPVLKTFIPPTVVAASIFILPVLHGAPLPKFEMLAAVVGWAWVYLFSNMLLCDLRDLRGDCEAGTRSLPVLLGSTRTRRLIVGLALLDAGMALVAWAASGRAVWLALAACAPAVIVGLLLATRRARGEGFYEWWVEGMFFVPAMALGVECLLG